MWALTRNFLYILPILFQIIAQCSSLKDVRVIVPNAVKRGDSATLKCQYDIESDLLYTVKWYKAEKEFYRYTPKENPAIKVFPNNAFNVLKKKSNESIVTLENIEQGAAGRYSCEVSADYPSFLTYVVSGSMDVVDIPAQSPTISGIKPRYRTGNQLRGNCTSKHSRPAANLTWYINGQVANSSYTKRYKSPELTNSAGLHTAVLGIHFLVKPQHFLTGKLKIRCTASVYGVYWQSTEKSIEEEKMKGGNGSRRQDGPGIVNVPPESQHVALTYPVHGTVLDPDPPPNYKDVSHAFGGASVPAKIDASSLWFATLLTVCARALNHR